jgi:SCP-2 sterol transfer family
VYEFRIEGERFHVDIDDGAVSARLAEAEQPDLVIETDVATSIDLMLRRLAPANALRSGSVTIDGSAAEFRRCIDLLAWVP